MLSITNLTKVYGLRPVLRGVDLNVAEGEVLALFGQNGAGKTTLLRCAAGLVRPTGGAIHLSGSPVQSDNHALRAYVGVVSHNPLLYSELSAAENLHFTARLYGLPPAETGDRIQAALARVGLGKRAADLVRTFSRGMLQRLALARATLHDPLVLLLDEPYTGLDQAGSAMLDGLIEEAASRGRAVLISTHDIERGLAISGRAAALVKGKITFEGHSPQINPRQLADVLTSPG
jgi:heme ABC exporter ATP-binding subunit CcmA